LALGFQSAAFRVLSNRRIGSNLRDQLDRASTSIALNIAEGAGRSASRDKAQFFAIARGSAVECAAVFDVLVARGLVPAFDHREARGLLVRIVQMLTRLIARQRIE
jgi:four helix bundle protein